MAVFPTLTPATRAFTPGEYPHTPFTTYNGLQNRVRHSNVMLSSSVRLSFIALAEADMLSILSHYQGQFGSFESFTLPSSIWSGVTTISDYELTDYRWRYTESPSVDDVYCGRYNVELMLETVPPEGKFVGGAELAVIITLASATVTTTNGLQQSVTLSIAGGAASEVIGGDGLQESITISLVGGTASVITGEGTADESSFWSDWAFTSSDIFLYEQGAATESPAYWMTWQALPENSPLLFEDAG
jgi:hypothetical protein